MASLFPEGSPSVSKSTMLPDILVIIVLRDLGFVNGFFHKQLGNSDVQVSHTPNLRGESPLPTLSGHSGTIVRVV